jgi:hypothetical protein
MDPTWLDSSIGVDRPCGVGVWSDWLQLIPDLDFVRKRLGRSRDYAGLRLQRCSAERRITL